LHFPQVASVAAEAKSNSYPAGLSGQM